MIRCRVGFVKAATTSQRNAFIASGIPESRRKIHKSRLSLFEKEFCRKGPRGARFRRVPIVPHRSPAPRRGCAVTSSFCNARRRLCNRPGFGISGGVERHREAGGFARRDAATYKSADEKVSPSLMSPVVNPLRNQFLRCCEVPWVKASGTTYPCDFI